MNNLIHNLVKSNLIYKYIKDNPSSIFVFFTLICLLYYKYKIVGFIVSFLAFILIPFYYKNDEWEKTTVIKIISIILPSLLLFYKLNFKLPININWVITILLVLNIFLMIFDVIDNPLRNSGFENNYLLAFLFLMVTLMTPYISFVKNQLIMTKILVKPIIFIIMYTITFCIYYKWSPHWIEHLYIILFCLIIPTISHFINNRWLETRALLLCLFIIFDLFDIKKYGY
jgi:hypothetical protein